MVVPVRDCCSSSSVMVEKLVGRCEVISGLAAPSIRRRLPYPLPVSSCCNRLLCCCCCCCACCSCCCCALVSFSAAVKTTIGLDLTEAHGVQVGRGRASKHTWEWHNTFTEYLPMPSRPPVASPPAGNGTSGTAR